MNESANMTERLITEFTENYMEKLFYFCLKKTGNTSEAEDLTQDIALNIITSLNRGTTPTSFSAWVWQIARNRYSVWADGKHRRSEAVIGDRIEDFDPADEDGDILENMIRKEQLSLLRRELAFISGDYRSIVTAYYIDDRSVRDIANSLSLSEDTVKQRLRRARKILKEGINMAREFGKLSYKPEDISFIANGNFGSKGEPWSYLTRALTKNIMLAAYRTPATAEELAVEVGVALPYIEEELNSLTAATLMKKNGNKYETNFFIVSAEAQEKIFAHLRGIAPELTKAVIDIIEFETDWKNKNCPEWHEGYQSYEDMKWTLLMHEADTLSIKTAEPYRKKAESPGSWGWTLRPDGGEWDILGMEEYHGDIPQFVSLHGCASTPEEKELDHINFGHYRFKYRDLEKKTPESLKYTDGLTLLHVAEGDGDIAHKIILERLEQYGYIKKTDDGYKPAFLVMFESKQKEMPPDVKAKSDALRSKAADLAARHYLFCREQIYREIPDFLKTDEHQIAHACENIFTMRGAILEEALRQDYIKYGDADDGRMIGAYLFI